MPGEEVPFPPAKRMLRSWKEVQPGLIIYFQTQFRVFQYTVVRKHLRGQFDHQRYVVEVMWHRPEHRVKKHLYWLYSVKHFIQLGSVWTNDEYEDVSTERAKKRKPGFDAKKARIG